MYKFMDRLARGFALLGGSVLTAIILLICLSVVGRSINSILHSSLIMGSMPDLSHTLLATGVGPINGDFEIAEAGMAFVIFAFLPLCQLNGSHASVDIFTASLSPGFNRILRAIVDVVFAAVIVLITWQLWLGTLSKFESGQTTLLLEFPSWWGYAASLFAAMASVIIAVFVASQRVIEAFTGREILPVELEADH